MIENALSFDVEEWFQVDCFFGIISRESWERQESRVAQDVDRILYYFSRFKAKATFFVLGWVAERNPDVVRRIAAEGHEIATHGYGHNRVYDQTPEEFNADVQRSVEILNGITGCRIEGYRAPFWTITTKTEWVWDILAQNGIIYESSINPISLLHGSPESPRFVHRRANGIIEYPLSTLRLFGRNWPVAAGFSLRVLPEWVTRYGIRQINRAGFPANVVLHTWELDPDPPRLSVGINAWIIHYAWLGTVERKLINLLSQFHFTTVRQRLMGILGE